MRHIDRARPQYHARDTGTAKDARIGAEGDLTAIS